VGKKKAEPGEGASSGEDERRIQGGELRKVDELQSITETAGLGRPGRVRKKVFGGNGSF